jgi:hypothetical protein
MSHLSLCVVCVCVTISVRLTSSSVSFVSSLSAHSSGESSAHHIPSLSLVVHHSSVQDPQVRAKMLSLATPEDSTVAFAMRSLARTGDNMLLDDYHGGDLSGSDSDSDGSPRPHAKHAYSPIVTTLTRSASFTPHSSRSSSGVAVTLAPLLDVVSQRDMLNDTIEVLSVVEDKHSKET